jgi:hypothetical protein
MAARKARRRVDTPARPGAGKATLRLGPELARRLAVVAAARCVTQSALVAELLEPYLSRWSVPNGPREPAGEPAEPDQTAPRLAI